MRGRGGEARAVVRQVLAIGALSILVAAVFHFPLIKRFARGEFREAFFLREDYPGLRMIGVAEAEDLFVSGTAVFFDARADTAFRDSHIPGARSAPYGSNGDLFAAAALDIPLDRTLVVYCEGGDCRSSLELAKLLHGRGFGDVRVLLGGWEEWQRAGLPEERTGD